MQAALDPNVALFCRNSESYTFQINPQSSVNPEHIDYFTFLGKLMYARPLFCVRVRVRAGFSGHLWCILCGTVSTTTCTWRLVGS